MAKLSDIAKVLIELRTTSIAKAEFGIPLVVSKGVKFGNVGELVRVYQSADEAVLDKTATIPDNVIKALRVIFSQQPRLTSAMVATLAYTRTVNVALDAPPSGGKYAAAKTIAFTLDTVALTVTTAADTMDTPALVSADLVRQLTANATLNSKYTAVIDPNGLTIVLTPKADTTVPVAVAGTGTSVSDKETLVESIPTQLANIQGYNDGWYGFAILDTSAETITAAAEWAESADPAVQHFAASTDDKIWTTPAGDAATDILSTLNRKQYERTALVPTKNTDALDAVAAMARFYVGQPGSIVAGLKTLVGVTPSAFTPSEIKNIKDKQGNWYTKYAKNVFLFNPGKAVSGRWLDEVRDRDWLVNYIQTEMVSALIRRPKVPYTNPGITTMENVLRGCLVRAQQMGVIAPDQTDALGNTVPGFMITVPNALDVPFSDKADRVLRLSFVALLAGAIQSIEVNGVLTYDYSEAA